MKLGIFLSIKEQDFVPYHSYRRIQEEYENTSPPCPPTQPNKNPDIANELQHSIQLQYCKLKTKELQPVIKTKSFNVNNPKLRIVPKNPKCVLTSAECSKIFRLSNGFLVLFFGKISSFLT